MKVSHEDCNAALNFQWSCLPSNCSSQSSRRNKSSGNGSSSSKGSEVYPRSRFHHAACSLGKYIYIFGGKDRYSPLRDMWMFDTLTQEWQQVENSNSTIPHLQGHTMLTYKSQIVIFGGTFSETREDTPLWIYNTDLNHVHKFFCESNTVRPVGRREHSAVIYKACMYIYGGFLDSSGSTDEFWAFSIEEEEWRLIHRHKPGKRHGHVAVVAENKMWLHGGMKGLNALSDLWTFSFGTNTWNKVKGIGVSPALSNHTAHVVKKSIIIFGGSKSGIFSQDIWIFKIDTLTWRLVSTQNGDLCPPITLHASVLLSAGVVQTSARDRSQSVPQLKGKSAISSELGSARPWTSPPVNTDTAKHALPSPEASFSVDILCLDTLRKDLDGNNNSSEEDIQNRSKTQWAEAETSFSSPEGTTASNDSNLEQRHLENNERITSNCVLPGLYRQPNISVKAPDLAARQPNLEDLVLRQNSETGRIRSASAEHCGDALPLLSRFHSMNSDADLGENNLTVTLSDEEIFHPGLSEYNACMLFNNSNLSADLDSHCKRGKQSDGEFMNSIYLNNAFSEQVSVTKNELFESSASVWKDKSQDIFKYVNTGLGAVEINDIFKLSKHSSENSLNKIYSYGQVDANYVNHNSRNEFNSSDKTAAFIKGLSIDYIDYKHIEERGRSTQHEPKCVTDLVVEDLELCDFSEYFHNIKISSPTRPYLRSTSLTDLYSCLNDTYNCVNSNFESSELLKGQLTRSCGNLLTLQNCGLHEKNLKAQKFLIDNVRIASSKMKHLKKVHPCVKSEAISGKYIKYGNVAGKTSSHPSKTSRGNLFKMANSGKISIGTQTTGSQMSLQSHEPNFSNMNRNFKFGHFMTNKTADTTTTTTDKTEAALYAEKSAEELKTMNSIFNETKLCILVIGGQTDNHSFHTEPLKMWKCCLY